MKVNQFIRIKKVYDQFRTELLKAGRLPVKDTGKGFWAISVPDDIFDLFKKIDLHEYGSFLDLGSGDGRVVMIASLFTRAAGIEYDEELHNKAMEIKGSLGMDCELHNKDYMEHDFSGYDVVFLNPDQRLHSLEPKLLSELKGRLVVYGDEFHPVSLVKDRTFHAHSTQVTIYHNRT